MRKRYGADYQVIAARSVKAALEGLGGLSDTGRQVSLVFADQWLPDGTGTELLARVRQLHPSARRVLLITWGDQASLEPMLEATVLGDIDAYVSGPGRHRTSASTGLSPSSLTSGADRTSPG